MKTRFYVGFQNSTGEDAWRAESPAYDNPERVTAWHLQQNLARIESNVWGPGWYCFTEARDIFTQECILIEGIIVLPGKKLSLYIDVAARERKLQETRLQF